MGSVHDNVMKAKNSWKQPDGKIGIVPYCYEYRRCAPIMNRENR